MRNFCQKNEAASSRYCEDLLNRLHQPIEEKYRTGAYIQPGGHELYKTDMRVLEEEYKLDDRKRSYGIYNLI